MSRKKKTAFKRETAMAIVTEATSTTTSWLKQLSLTDRKYVDDVIQEMLRNPDASILSVATALAYELSINRSSGTIARTLKEMIRNAKKAT